MKKYFILIYGALNIISCMIPFHGKLLYSKSCEQEGTHFLFGEKKLLLILFIF